MGNKEIESSGCSRAPPRPLDDALTCSTTAIPRSQYLKVVAWATKSVALMKASSWADGQRNGTPSGFNDHSGLRMALRLGQNGES